MEKEPAETAEEEESSMEVLKEEVGSSIEATGVLVRSFFGWEGRGGKREGTKQRTKKRTTYGVAMMMKSALNPTVKKRNPPRRGPRR